MVHHAVSLARSYAEAIRQWHARHGLARALSRLSESQYSQYASRVKHFHGADLSDAGAQLEIAREQQSATFEWAYVEVVPAGLWNEVAGRHDLLDQPPPQHLGAAAGWILQYCPQAMHLEPQQDDSSRSVIEVDTREGLLEKAAHFYADVVAEQRPGLGGLNALISCSLERYPWDGGRHGRTTLVRPEVLGLRLKVPGEQPDDFVDAVRLGEVVVEAATAGPIEPSAHSMQDDDMPSEQ